MKKRIFKKILSLFLCLALIFSLSVTLISCKKNDGDNNQNSNSSSDKTDNTEKPKEDYHDKIVVPAYKDYERGTIDFDKISYSRPNFEAASQGFVAITEKIKANTESFEEQLRAIVDLEDEYSFIRSMYALANIYNSKDTSSDFWNTEFAYVSESYPKFAKIIEDMFVAAANSPHCERFEDEYFGEGLIDEYKDGGIFTDTVVALWAEEEALESEYSSLSTSDLELTYKGETASAEKLLNSYLEKYGEKSEEYLKAQAFIMKEYTAWVEEQSREIFISLITVRKKIATELGNESYLDFAYKTHGRDYSSADASLFLDDVAKYISPLYSFLNYYAFRPFFEVNAPSEVALDELINKSYKMLGGADSDLADMFAYMLQHKLYDVELAEQNRHDGAFTTYIDDYNAPFIFMSSRGNIDDYATLFHEFGHFADSYINNDSGASIDQKEISSQGLEYLMLLYMQDELSVKDQQYLLYSKFEDALETLLFQSFYAKAEELIYSLPLSMINEENLNEQVVLAAEKFGLNTKYINDISVLFIPHTFLYPFYVQSYAVSIVPALELYFAEKENAGAGFDSYRKIIDRGETNLTLEQTLERANLDSPFEKDILRTLADKISYAVIGRNFYDTKTPSNDAEAA